MARSRDRRAHFSADETETSTNPDTVADVEATPDFLTGENSELEKRAGGCYYDPPRRNWDRSDPDAGTGGRGNRVPSSFRIGFFVDSESSVDEKHRQLEEDGYDVTDVKTRHNTYDFYVEAPGGFFDSGRDNPVERSALGGELRAESVGNCRASIRLSRTTSSADPGVVCLRLSIWSRCFELLRGERESSGAPRRRSRPWKASGPRGRMDIFLDSCRQSALLRHPPARCC